MAVEVGIGVLTDLLEELLIIDRANELDARVVGEMEFLLQCLLELLVGASDDREVTLGMRQHKLTDHDLEGVLRDKAADNKVVVARCKAMLMIPALQSRIVVRQGTPGHVCTIGNVGRIGIAPVQTLAVILLMDISLDIDGIADHEITVADHDAFRPFPISADRCRPLGTHPFVSVGVKIDAPPQFVDASIERWHDRTDPAGHNIDNGILNVMALNVIAAPVKGCDIIPDRLSMTDLRHADLVAIRVMEGKFILRDALIARQLCLVLAALSVRLAGNVILDVRIVLVVLGQLVDKGLVAAIGAEALRADKEYMLDVVSLLCALVNTLLIRHSINMGRRLLAPPRENSVISGTW